MTRLLRLFPLALLAVATLAGSGPPPETAAEPPIRLIVRGDDMGSSRASNEAAVRCFRDGVMRDVELMAVGPWFPQAARLLRELRAQVELTKREVPQLSHLSDHMGFQALGPEVAALVKRLAAEYQLDIDPEALGARPVGWYGKPEAPADKVVSFTRLVEELPPGTWLFVDHPALDTPEMRATGHVGYETVAVDRQGVTDAWTSPAVRETVRRRGIELIGYKDLVRK